jgi:protein-disulfide isomerase
VLQKGHSRGLESAWYFAQARSRHHEKMELSTNNPMNLTIPISKTDHAIGSPDAPITLVEYGDYECPDCLNAQPIVKELRARLGERLRFVFRHFPRSSVHPRASVAAMAAEAAGEQGRFWDMHESLFKHQKDLENVDFTHLALQLGLEVYRFGREMESNAWARRVREHFDGGETSGVRGTPTFFINGRRYAGKIEIDAMAKALGEVKPG